MLTLGVLGYGGRGRWYARISKMIKNLKVVAVVDNNLGKLKTAKKEQKLADNRLFSDFDAFLQEEKLCDILFICTQDLDHYGHAMQALEKGYDIVLEKPVSPDIEECLAIEKRALELGRKVDVCHVLRYTPFYNKIKKVTDSGVLGQLVGIEMVENVGYWHYAHSYVRGDWRNSATSSPMILAKCCHDLDLAVYFTDSPCKQISSIGGLVHFKRENEPNGAADRCFRGGCQAKADCPFDAEKIYWERFKKVPLFMRPFKWPHTRLVPDGRPTKKSLEKALTEGQFGRCVYRCDNNVVDYQSVQMEFENGIRVSLTMTAFSEKINRQIRIRGTKGELWGDMCENRIYYQEFGKKKKRIRLMPLSGLTGHISGDIGLLKRLSEGKLQTDITRSVESHLMADAAERSRVEGGVVIEIH